MSRWAAGLRLNSSHPRPCYQAKRFLLDSLGCALGGYLQHDVQIALAVLDEIAGDGPATVIGSGRRVDPVSGIPGQCADDPLHGLQRHLLEAGSISSFRHFPGSVGLLRTRPPQRKRTDRRSGAGARIRDAPLRSRVSWHPRARMAPCHPNGICCPDRRGPRAAPDVGTNPARHRNLGPAGTARWEPSLPES